MCALESSRPVSGIGIYQSGPKIQTQLFCLVNKHILNNGFIKTKI